MRIFRRFRDIFQAKKPSRFPILIWPHTILKKHTFEGCYIFIFYQFFMFNIIKFVVIFFTFLNYFGRTIMKILKSIFKKRNTKSEVFAQQHNKPKFSVLKPHEMKYYNRNTEIFFLDFLWKYQIYFEPLYTRKL